VFENLKLYKKKIGLRQCTKAIKNGEVKTVVLAKDATDKIINTINELCQGKELEIVYFEDMKQLGKACEIDVGTAVVCIIK
jgi:large subunit ribosomal protein L7A